MPCISFVPCAGKIYVCRFGVGKTISRIWCRFINERKSAGKEAFGITNEELADYQTITVTNKEEHQYLDEYLASKVIGTRALSSVMIEEADAGSGIEVETHNISFCSKEMYTNALVTAGISDAKVTVAGPFPISGTAALVGAMKAYGEMTGEGVDEASSDAATMSW